MIRDDLYSITLLSRPDSSPAVFHLGEPITLEFSSVRETLKPNDWIGLYGVTHNPDKRLTTAQCGDKWTYVTGPNPPGWTPPTTDSTPSSAYSLTNSSSTYGSTRVTVSHFTTPNERGLRKVVGQLTLRDSQLPWTVGVYEARYHFAGKHACIAVSRPFEIVPIVSSLLSIGESLTTGYNTPSSSSSPVPDEKEHSEQLLTRIVTACLDVKPNTVVLNPKDDFFTALNVAVGTSHTLLLLTHINVSHTW